MTLKLFLTASVMLLGLTAPIFSYPLGINGADPSVIQTKDGFLSVESRAGRTLLVRTAPSLAALAEAKPVRIWSDREGLGEVWAPEMVFRGGQYEVHFAAGVGSDHRMYVIRSADPIAGYSDAVEIALPEDRWSIDGLPFTYKGANYYVWSGWQGDTDVQQDIFLAAMTERGAVQSPRARISSPDRAYENIAGDTPSVNEGPQPIIDPAGQLHIVYSANGSWGDDYCISDLRLKANRDPLDPDAWEESAGCLFGANPETLAENGTLTMAAKGVGHHTFVLPNGSPLGASDGSVAEAFLYHGVPAMETPDNFWAAREWFVGTFRWVPNISFGADPGWSLSFSE